MTSAVLWFAASTTVACGDIVTSPTEAAWQSSMTSSNLVDFESNSGAVGNTYLGLGVAFANFNTGVPTFWIGAGLNSAQSLYTKTFTGEGGGGFSTAFTNPQKGVAFWSLDVEFAGSTVSFYDSANNFLKSFDLQASGTGHGQFVYGFNGYISDFTDIGRMDLAVITADAVWFDDVQFGVSSIPEPGTSWLALVSILAIRLASRRVR